MNIDTELETWREVWHSSEVTDQSGTLDMQRAVQCKRFRLKALYVLEIAWAVCLLVFSFEVARHLHSGEMFVWASVIWILTLGAAAYSVWNWRSLWRVEPKSTSEYVRAYERYCVAGLREIRFGYYFLAVGLAITIPWLSWKFFRSGPGNGMSFTAYLISMGLVAALTAGYLCWFSRSRKTRMHELEQLKQYKEILNEET